MLEKIILGIVQGISEWLPVSSEALIVLIKTNFQDVNSNLSTTIQEALFLHFGTFLAALFYFRKEVKKLIDTLISFNKAKKDDRLVFNFLIVSTFISGFLGFILLKTIEGIEDKFTLTGKTITFAVGLLLLITAYLQVKQKETGVKQIRNLSITDGVLLGAAQGASVLPGLSRSGLTVSLLLLRRFDKALSLKLSFLMSLPIVFLGNILLNIKYFRATTDAFWGLIPSFFFGLLTIDLLLKLAKRVNFGYFVLVFGLITLLTVFI